MPTGATVPAWPAWPSPRAIGVSARLPLRGTSNTKRVLPTEAVAVVRLVERAIRIPSRPRVQVLAVRPWAERAVEWADNPPISRSSTRASLAIEEAAVGSENSGTQNETAPTPHTAWSDDARPQTTIEALRAGENDRSAPLVQSPRPVSPSPVPHGPTTRGVRLRFKPHVPRPRPRSRPRHPDGPRSTALSSALRARRLALRARGLARRARNSGLGTQSSGLRARGLARRARNSELGTQSSGLGARGSLSTVAAEFELIIRRLRRATARSPSVASGLTWCRGSPPSRLYAWPPPQPSHG